MNLLKFEKFQRMCILLHLTLFMFQRDLLEMSMVWQGFARGKCNRYFCKGTFILMGCPVFGMLAGGEKMSGKKEKKRAVFTRERHAMIAVWEISSFSTENVKEDSNIQFI